MHQILKEMERELATIEQELTGFCPDVVWCTCCNIHKYIHYSLRRNALKLRIARLTYELDGGD